MAYFPTGCMLYGKYLLECLNSILFPTGNCTNLKGLDPNGEVSSCPWLFQGSRKVGQNLKKASKF